MIVTLLLTFLFLLLVHHYSVRFGRAGRLIDRIPGFSTIPILGSAHHAFTCTTPEKILVLRKRLVAYPICKLWTLTIPHVFIHHPDDIEKILSSTKNIEKSLIYTLLHPWLGDGLLTSKGTKWQERRKMLTPAFHFSILKQFTEILIEEGNRATRSFDCTKETIIENVMSFTSHHTLNAICETSMGISLNNIGPIQQQYRRTIHNMGTVIINRLFEPWLFSDTIFKLTSLNRRQTEYLSILHSFTEKIIAERRKYHEQTGGRYLSNFEDENESENDEVLGLKKRRLAMLDMLIAESYKNKLSDSDIKEEVDTFVFEGHDTVSIASCFTLLLLAEHKDIQDRVRIEITNVMQENDGKLTMNALQNLSYLERCIKEALRLYPSVHYISRVCSEDVQLKSYLVPADTTVHILIYEAHRDPNVWPNPEIFDPDRFLPENFQNRHPYSYIPFSAGPRNCIGQRFAMLELKALIAPLICNNYLEPVDYLKDAVLYLEIVLRTKNPMRMKIIPIKHGE